MYITIAANKAKFNGILAGEELLIKIDAIKKVDETKIGATISTYLYGQYSAIPQIKKPGQILGLPSYLEFETTLCFFTVAVKKVYQWLIDNLGLIEPDLEILADYQYLEDKAVRPIRLTIPFDVILKTEGYRNLVGQMLDFSVPEYQENDYYSLYLEEIYPDDKAILEADERVLIEE